MKCNKFIGTSFSVLIASALLSGAVIASPSLDAVSQGSATVTQTPATTTVTQSSQSATLSWNSFNVATNESVRFIQPNSNALAVNNILDQAPSTIHGSITANGRVVLLNPNGFYFGATSSVSAHTFIAAATSLSNTHYQSGQNTLTILDQSLVTGTIDALGSITTHANTQLVARTITHKGSITAGVAGAPSAVSIRARELIEVHGSIHAPQGQIDIFATEGSSRSYDGATISTLTPNYDHSQAPGFVEFSGKHIALSNNLFTLNPQDTLLLDPEYIVIQGGSRPTTCPADIDCPTDMEVNMNITAGTGYLVYL